jgi:hypothetical protein
MAKKTKIKYKQLIQTQSTQSSKSTEFNPDYSDVIKDLKRIGILAGVFFAVLVGLSFFIS